MGRAILASAAISGIVLPIRVGANIATDGGWVRNFPFEHAYRNPSVEAIAAFRYVPSYPVSDGAFLERTRERLELFRAVPPVRDAPRRGASGPGASLTRRAGALRGADRPAHARRLRAERGRSRSGLRSNARRRSPSSSCSATTSHGAAVAAAPRWRRKALRAELDARFAAARFPFRHERHVPTLVVRGTSGPDSLDPTFRSDAPWPEERKRALIDRGYTLTDETLERTRSFCDSAP